MMVVAERASRDELGYFVSTVCFKAVITGVEEALGEKAATIAFIAAGRKRGKQLVEEMALTNRGAGMPLEDIQEKLAFALGNKGTRLCIVDKIERVEGGFNVYTRETVCSNGEPEGSTRSCTYTLGAIQGFLETLFGKRLRAKHTESVLRGSEHDVLTYQFLA